MSRELVVYGTTLNQRIAEIIAAKKDAALADLSVEELEASRANSLGVRLATHPIRPLATRQLCCASWKPAPKTACGWPNSSPQGNGPGGRPSPGL
jgi:hypothetical protein